MAWPSWAIGLYFICDITSAETKRIAVIASVVMILCVFFVSRAWKVSGLSWLLTACSCMFVLLSLSGFSRWAGDNLGTRRLLPFVGFLEVFAGWQMESQPLVVSSKWGSFFSKSLWGLKCVLICKAKSLAFALKMGRLKDISWAVIAWDFRRYARNTAWISLKNLSQAWKSWIWES